MPAIYKNKKLRTSVVLFVIFALPIYFILKGYSNRSQPLGTGIVRRSDLVQKVTVAGHILPNRRTSITPPYNAYIKRIHVKMGDKVKAGMPIVSLVQSLHDVAEQNFPLRAPIDGTVVQIPRSEGEYVEMGKDLNTIVRIDDLSKLFINAEIPEADIRKIRLNQEVIVRANGVFSRSYQGKIVEIAIAAKEKERWGRTGDKVDFEIKLEILDADEQIQPGMSAIIDVITTKKTNILVLDHEFISKSKETYFVHTLDSKRKEVKVGVQNEESYEIIEGLNEGEKIKAVDYLSLPDSPT